MDGADLTFCALRKKASQSEAVTFILRFDVISRGNMFKNVLRVRLKIDPVGVPAHSHPAD